LSKIFEALAQAQQRLKIKRKAPALPFELKVFSMEYEMIELYQSLKTLLTENRRIIQFMGSQPREGSSSIAREFARVLAFRVGKAVFFLDADQGVQSSSSIFNTKVENYIEDVIKSNKNIDEAYYQVGESNLFIGSISNNSRLSPDLFDSPRIDKLWDKLRTRFDLVVIDSPPGAISSVGYAISRSVDGVVLVVEAEKTRWPVVMNVKERILQQGGNILGVVFNKRKFYIPRWIYKRL
jgi:protein-tyrosine kinase